VLPLSYLPLIIEPKTPTWCDITCEVEEEELGEAVPALRLIRTLSPQPPLPPLNYIISRDMVWADILALEVDEVVLSLQVQITEILQFTLLVSLCPFILLPTQPNLDFVAA